MFRLPIVTPEKPFFEGFFLVTLLVVLFPLEDLRGFHGDDPPLKLSVAGNLHLVELVYDISLEILELAAHLVGAGYVYLCLNGDLQLCQDLH